MRLKTILLNPIFFLKSLLISIIAHFIITFLVICFSRGEGAFFIFFIGLFTLMIPWFIVLHFSLCITKIWFESFKINRNLILNIKRLITLICIAIIVFYILWLTRSFELLNIYFDRNFDFYPFIFLSISYIISNFYNAIKKV